MLNKKIEYFVTLAECLSFTQAAAAHSVSQTAISQYIASLEAKLQVRLFNRNAHAVSLTDAGKFFYERVTFMLRYESDTKKRLIAIAEQYSGYVKVGIGMYESRHTEDFFSRFLLSHPEIKVDIFQYPYGALTEKLKSGELDVILANVLCEKAFAKEEILSRPMFESFNYLVADRSIAEKYPPGTRRPCFGESASSPTARTPAPTPWKCSDKCSCGNLEWCRSASPRPTAPTPRCSWSAPATALPSSPTSFPKPGRTTWCALK